MNDSRPPATVRMIEEEDASAEVRAIYEDIKATKGIDGVPPFWRTIATNPAQLKMVWEGVKRWMHPEADGHASQLSPLTREIIAVAVSATNGCPYCVTTHTAMLKALGADETLIGEVMAIASLFNMTNTIANGYLIEPPPVPQ